MTPLQILRKLESTRKAYSKLWDRLEALEEDIDEADDQEASFNVPNLSSFDVSEMKDNLGMDIGNLDESITAFKRTHRRKL